jgi:hypothetical protein
MSTSRRYANVHTPNDLIKVDEEEKLEFNAEKSKIQNQPKIRQLLN